MRYQLHVPMAVVRGGGRLLTLLRRRLRGAGDLLVLCGEPGQGLDAEVRELIDLLRGLGQPFLELGVLCLEPGNLGLARIGGLAGLAHGVQASFERDVEGRVGAGAVERTAVDRSLGGEGLDVALSAGLDLAA
ncbi:hypothetical protein [Streptomyces atratus]|uniref:hypothetical protein n=1 Tax=Streptomyces atratus TaxID=1893 RepID=UPI003795C1F5